MTPGILWTYGISLSLCLCLSVSLSLFLYVHVYEETYTNVGKQTERALGKREGVVGKETWERGGNGGKYALGCSYHLGAYAARYSSEQKKNARRKEQASDRKDKNAGEGEKSRHSR
jgi:hypothetical protein